MIKILQSRKNCVFSFYWMYFFTMNKLHHSQYSTASGSVCPFGAIFPICLNCLSKREKKQKHTLQILQSAKLMTNLVISLAECWERAQTRRTEVRAVLSTANRGSFWTKKHNKRQKTWGNVSPSLIFIILVSFFSCSVPLSAVWKESGCCHFSFYAQKTVGLNPTVLYPAIEA